MNLIRLLNPNGPQMWERDIIIQTMPSVPEVDLGNVDEHVAVAMRMRPDLNQARLLVQRDELSVVQTKNGLLPRMDLFVNVGRTGYADSFGGSTHGDAGLGYDVQFGGIVEYPPLNRAARAAYTRSLLSKDQQIESLRNAEQLAQVDVRTAYIEVNRTREQVTATAATRKLQEETLRAETEKFRVGKSTSLLVAAAQRDLLVSADLRGPGGRQPPQGPDRAVPPGGDAAGPHGDPGPGLRAGEPGEEVEQPGDGPRVRGYKQTTRQQRPGAT